MAGHAKKLNSPDELARIAQELYVYAYPLVLMDVTRRVATNTERPQGMQAPANRFAHLSRFPDASFTEVVRPNADTLYSSLWLDVTDEPLVISVPDSWGRYYLLPLLDMWTDVFAAPGARTTGTNEQAYAVTGPGWHGRLPAGVEEIRSPTGTAWMIGRTQTNGPADYENVRKFQAGLTATPLSQWGDGGRAASPGRFDPGQDMSAPPGQVAAMSGPAFFATAAAVMAANPPHLTDTSMLQRARQLGFRPGEPFDPADAPRRGAGRDRERARRGDGRDQGVASPVRRAGQPVADGRVADRDVRHRLSQARADRAHGPGRQPGGGRDLPDGGGRRRWAALRQRQALLDAFRSRTRLRRWTPSGR